MDYDISPLELNKKNQQNIQNIFKLVISVDNVSWKEIGVNFHHRGDINIKKNYIFKKFNQLVQHAKNRRKNICQFRCITGDSELSRKKWIPFTNYIYCLGENKMYTCDRLLIRSKQMYIYYKLL